MGYRPFLSHKREDASDLQLLKHELRLRGAGSWQDVDDLRLGQRFTAAFKRAIGRETGGFIWWGTRLALSSRTIRKIEVPAALRRHRMTRRGAYPVVPLFVDISPGADADDIKKAFGRRRGKRLCELNGVVRERRENMAHFAARAARRYVADMVRGHSGDELRVAITGGREPVADYDLVLDWRAMLDELGRLHDSTVLPLLVETLADIRTAAQGQERVPRIVVETHLRLPLAVLVGWEWNRIRPIDLRIIQVSTRGAMRVDDLNAELHTLPEPRELSFDGEGPHVLAVSVGKSLGETLTRYSRSVDACAATHLHVDGLLDAQGICSVAQWTIDRLATLNAEGVAKHLLLLAPTSLAVRIGASANATGKTTVPFWDGDTGYGPAIILG
jgi:hypothetical protein